jgi:cyanate lyase
MENGKEEIIAKIMKLMELSNEDKNGNPNEREQAAKKAAELMAKWAIDFADLRTQKPSENVFVTIMVDGSESSKVDFESSMAYTIAQAFDCKMINTYREGPWKIAFVGSKHDLDIAIYFFKFLRRTMYAMAIKNVTKETVKPAYGRTRVNVLQARRNYCFGLVQTIFERLKDLYMKREEFIPSDSKALMVVKKGDLQNYFKQQFPDAISGKATSLKGDIGAYYRGKQDGQKVSLNRPISHTGASPSQIN